ncbi:hypothetical protein J8J27_30120, partial [Mycobacterium tuberculosis]|nr:hypothetical protein [Mycobacterium tuberculosis]
MSRALDDALAHYQAGRPAEALAGLLALPGVTRTPAGRTLIAGLLIDLQRPAEALPHLQIALQLMP